MKKSTTTFVSAAMAFLFVALLVGSATAPPCMASDLDDYSTWSTVGKRAGKEALALMNFQEISPWQLITFGDNLIAMTNAGFAEIDGYSTQGCLDGLSQAMGVSRGMNSLLEIQSHPEKSLFFAVYHKTTGRCVYLQVDPDFAASDAAVSTMDASVLFSKTSVVNIKAEYLFANPDTAAAAFAATPFNGNEFRIVTILNAVDSGAPTYAIRSFEFHDHYCPGVTSGIMIAQYVKKHFAMQTASDSYFVQGIQPWCKEDALMVMLNATPGKGGYSVTYPTDDDKAGWWSEFTDAVNIVYRKNGNTGIWQGLILGFQWGETDCPAYDNSLLDKLCMDMWYLDKLDAPEDFVYEILSFELPEGVTPKDMARPGYDPMAVQ